MQVLNKHDMDKINGGLSFNKLIGSMVTGGVMGALRGISGGPIGMIGGAVFGAGLGAATCAINDAATLSENKPIDMIFNV